jgi:ABC-type transport system substrate-binding protein
VPLSMRHWALGGSSPQFLFDPRVAADVLRGSRNGAPMQFTCLVAPDSLEERIALALQRQFSAVGITMAIEESSRENTVRRAADRQYEAILAEVISGPTLLRPYLIWHTDGPINWGHFGNKSVDSALDRARSAASEGEYRGAVAAVQRAFVEDPPAIFLAWSVQTRALSRRFEVPPLEPGRDILSNIHLWKPVDEGQASQN